MKSLNLFTKKAPILKIVFFFLFISLPFLGLFLGFWLGVKYSKTTFLQSATGSTEREAPIKEKDCVSLAPPEYKLAEIGDVNQLKGERPAKVEVDFDNDGKGETVHVYNENAKSRSLPIVIKVFSGNKPCLKEEFSYGTIDRKGNELGSLEAFDDFWGDGRRVVMFISISTAYGSGDTEYMNFLTLKDGRYQVISGPTLSELTSYMFLDKKNKGRQILVADAKSMWEAGEAHFDPHRCRFERWDWNVKDYSVVKLGETQNKYDLSVGIEEIIRTEPEVLTPRSL